MPRVAWHELAVVHRLEYPLPITYLCYAAWGACFAAGDVRQLLTVSVVLAVAGNALLILAALALNTAVDVRTDARHAGKNYLAGALHRFGRRRVLRWVCVEASAGLACSCAVAVHTGRWIVPGAAAVAVLLHGMYNIEPVRLKRRGFAGPAAFGLGLVGMPFLLAYFATRPELEVSVWPILGGLTALAIGRTAWWSVPDRAADIATGIATPPVRHGTARVLTLTGVIMMAGLILLGWGVWWRYGPVWVALGLAAHTAFVATALAPLRRVSGGTTPSPAAMRTRGMTLVMIGEVTLTAVPLVA